MSWKTDLNLLKLKWLCFQIFIFSIVFSIFFEVSSLFNIIFLQSLFLSNFKFSFFFNNNQSPLPLSHCSSFSVCFYYLSKKKKIKQQVYLLYCIHLPPPTLPFLPWQPRDEVLLNCSLIGMTWTCASFLFHVWLKDILTIKK